MSCPPYVILLAAGLFATSCVSDPPSPPLPSDLAEVRELAVPAERSLAPNLFVRGDTTALLSWLEGVDDTTYALRYARLEAGGWGEPAEVTRGSNWFVNWADFPSLAAFSGPSGNLATHWLQKSAPGTFDYDVHIALSDPGGRNWSSSFIPHRDGVPAEHGFVTLLPLGAQSMMAVWLDGRHTLGEGHTHAGGGAMTLRSAFFDPQGQLSGEAELDERVCDCCQTDAALTGQGPVVVYRDRSEGEIRDIGIVRLVDGAWTEPALIHADHWEIAGCPVNGPAVAASGSRVAVAWFTGAGNERRVKVAFSEDAGATFLPPLRVDEGDPVGRVDIVFVDEQTVLVSWLENTTAGGELRLARFRTSGKVGESLLATSMSTSRQSGFPILEKVGSGYLLAWTQAETPSRVRSIRFSL